MSEAGKEGAGAQEERPRRAGASWERGKLGGRQPAPRTKELHKGLGAEGQILACRSRGQTPAWTSALRIC